MRQRLIAFIIASFTTLALLSLYLYLQHRNQLRWTKAREAPRPPVLAHIYADEPVLRGGQAVISGTVVNASNSRLENVQVEVELIPRIEGTIETRTIRLTPDSLAPGEKGRYVLSVPPNRWSLARPVKLRAGEDGREIAFEASLGERRPPDPPHLQTNDARPRSPSGFINTPDNPVNIP